MFAYLSLASELNETPLGAALNSLYEAGLHCGAAAIVARLAAKGLVEGWDDPTGGSATGGLIGATRRIIPFYGPDGVDAKGTVKALAQAGFVADPISAYEEIADYAAGKLLEVTELPVLPITKVAPAAPKSPAKAKSPAAPKSAAAPQDIPGELGAPLMHKDVQATAQDGTPLIQLDAVSSMIRNAVATWFKENDPTTYAVYRAAKDNGDGSLESRRAAYQVLFVALEAQAADNPDLMAVQAHICKIMSVVAPDLKGAKARVLNFLSRTYRVAGF